MIEILRVEDRRQRALDAIEEPQRELNLFITEVRVTEVGPPRQREGGAKPRSAGPHELKAIPAPKLGGALNVLKGQST